MKNILVVALLLGLSLVLMMAALYLMLVFVPAEVEMGILQRIFYLHIPVCWLAFLAFFVVFLGSLIYLWRRDNKWDVLAYSSAEIGLVFTTLALVTGSIWAKAIWGVWWTWDARLTSTLVLWVIYLTYFIIRISAVDGLRGATLSAVIGIVGFIDLPACALAIVLWRTQHPSPIIFQGGLTPAMLLTLLVSLAAFSTLYFLLLSLRMSLRNEEVEIKRLKESYQ